ncbi:MAG: FliI/YscN family ATPase [Phycisphaeraceae bacterium]|nr:FliI/YscN family ATPase [Phycisphaeraceae bacterium]
MIDAAIDLARHAALMGIEGVVSESRGLAVRVRDFPVSVGSLVTITPRGDHRASVEGEVVGFDERTTVVMPFGASDGFSRGDRVRLVQYRQMIPSGPAMLGRVIDALGRPLDGHGPLAGATLVPLHRKPVDPMTRPVIDTPLSVGVRAIDGICTVGRGQRLGIFAQPGLGKSTLLAEMARKTDADVAVIGLVGERGREVRDFIENQLAQRGLERCVVVAATSDEPALMRIRAAHMATAIAESFRDEGKDVLLLMDSVTRFCQALRQVGLSSGEPPATKGFPPSVFAALPLLLERAGRTERGSITAFYTVLVEGDEVTDPIADATRGILDGHIQLSRTLAEKGHWPAIDILGSISRVAIDVTDAPHQAARNQVIRLEHSYRQVEELNNLGAYVAGSNPDFDLALAARGMLDQFLCQSGSETQPSDFHRTRAQLLAMHQQLQAATRQLGSDRQRQGASAGSRSQQR